MFPKTSGLPGEDFQFGHKLQDYEKNDFKYSISKLSLQNINIVWHLILCKKSMLMVAVRHTQAVETNERKPFL